MRPIPGTITDPNVTKLLRTGKAKPEEFGGPTLTAEEWQTFARLAGYLKQQQLVEIRPEEARVLDKLLSSRV